MTTKWVQRYAARTGRMQGSAIRELLKLTQQPDIISFAGGMPAPELFPTKEVIAATHRVLEQQGAMALQYGLTEGYLPLREMIVRHIQRFGIFCAPENVLITSGSQQALDLIGKIMINPGDKIAVEEPTYLGALQAWNAYEAEYVTIPTDDDGMKTDALEEVLATQNIKFIYALPNFQNPTGITMSAGRRAEMVRLADKYDVPIVEDDPYGQLRYEGKHEKPMIVIDAQRRPEECYDSFEMGNVLYMSTFSKTLCPGFRVAWMVGPREVIQKVVVAKQGADLHTSTMAQMVAYETAHGGFLDKHVARLREAYKERRDLMLELMEETFPPGVTWTRPKGGLFLWVRLPEGVSAAAILKKAAENKVAFVPGTPFYPHGGGENTFRMNFSNANPEMITEGIKRLAAVIKDELVTA
jgi:2-aminoadipate transaminase